MENETNMPKKPRKKSLPDRIKSWPGRAAAKVRSNRWLQALLAVAVVLIVVIAALLGWFYNKHKDEPTILGVSFSVKYAKEMGLDWEENYRALLEDLGFRHFRLMSYWDTIELERNKYDFTDLDKQFALAEQYGAKINLAVGERQPRWPECHRPSWTHELNNVAFEEELFEYITQVVNRYKNSPALQEYQLENEIFNNLFGECEKVSRARVQAEYNLVKSLDPNHPVGINVSNQSGTPVREPVGDRVGFSMYRKSTGKLLGVEFYWAFWYVPPQWHALRAAFIEAVHGAPTFVHELQTEPWGKRATVDLSLKEQNASMTAADIERNVHFAERTGMNEIFMWGGEWWYWRKTQWNDPSLWETVRGLLNEPGTQKL